MTVAFAHGTFNITNTIIQFPFIGALAFMVTKLIPGEDEVVKYEPLYLDEQLIKQAPSIALGNAKKNFFTWVIMLRKPLTSLTTISSTLMKKLQKRDIRLKKLSIPLMKN